MTKNSRRNRQWIGRVVLTTGIVCGASGTIFFLSGTLKAIGDIDRVDRILADLSRYIADGHGWIRERVVTLASFDDEALARFDKGVERRVAEIRNLNARFVQQTSVSFWTQPMWRNADVYRVDEERREYVTAASAAATTPLGDPAMNLRMFDLHAQKLIQTVEAVRDSADSARARALIAVRGIVALSSTLSMLLIAYLLWRPVFGSAHHADSLAGAV